MVTSLLRRLALAIVADCHGGNQIVPMERARSSVLRRAVGLTTLGLLASSIALTTPAEATDAPSKEYLDGVATRFIQSRNAQLLTRPASAASAAAAASAADATPRLVAREMARLTELRSRRDRLSAAGERYSAARTDATVLSTRQAGDSLVVRAREVTELDYVKVRGSEPALTAFSVDREFTFTRSGSRWLLADVTLAGGQGLAPVNEVVAPTGTKQAARPAAASRTNRVRPQETSANEKRAGGSGEVTAAAGFNYVAMADYAKRHWSSYNPNYRAYSNDCTNFISQAMRAGGWWYVGSGAFERTNNNKWYYGSYTWTTSYTWAGAHNWYWFARNSGRAYGLTNVWYMGLADVLQLDFDRNGNIDHTMLVTAVGSNGERYLTYHTNNTLNRSLSSIINSYPSSWYYAHRT